MAVAVAGLWIALDQRVGRYRHRPGIALVAESAELDVHLFLRAGDDLIRDTDTLARENARAEIRMHAHAGTNKGDDRARIRICR